MISAIREFDGYFADTSGMIVSKKSGQFRALKPWISKHGYALVDLSVKGKIQHKSVHRLMALTYLPNPENKPEVNHKNGDKLNNEISNLEWATKSENITHSFGVLNNPHPRARRVRCIETGEVYKSLNFAARENGTNASNLCAMMKGRRKLAGGYTWEFYNG